MSGIQESARIQEVAGMENIAVSNIYGFLSGKQGSNVSCSHAQMGGPSRCALFAP